MSVVRLWWRPWGLEDTPATFFACSARRASSGAIRKNFVRAASFRVMPTNPPETFIERFLCSSALWAPTAQNGSSAFLFTTQFPLINSRFLDLMLSRKTSQQGTQESYVHSVFCHGRRGTWWTSLELSGVVTSLRFGQLLWTPASPSPYPCSGASPWTLGLLTGVSCFKCWHLLKDIEITYSTDHFHVCFLHLGSCAIFACTTKFLCQTLKSLM